MDENKVAHDAKQANLLPPRGRRAALVVVDVQNDFFNGGAVPYPNADAIVPIINKLRNGFRFDLVAFSQDIHPPNHISFVSSHMLSRRVKPFTTIDVVSTTSTSSSSSDAKAESKTQSVFLWPDHCVEQSRGVDFVKGLHVFATDVVVRKGQAKDSDSDSVFYESDMVQTDLARLLKQKNISDVFFVGVGLDRAIAKSAIQAASDHGYNTFVVQDACVGLFQTREEAMTMEMEKAGVMMVKSGVLFEERDDKRKEVSKYLAKHNIHAIFEKLCASLIYHKPANPNSFLIRELQKLQELQDTDASLSCLSLFTDEDVDVYFSMMDPTNKGVLDRQQAMKALTGLGIAPATAAGHLLHEQDTFTPAEFKILVKRASEQSGGSGGAVSASSAAAAAAMRGGGGD